MADAIQREKRLKQWCRARKIRLIDTMSSGWVDVFNETTGTILDGPVDLARGRG